LAVICSVCFWARSGLASFDQYTVTDAGLGLNSFNVTWDSTSTLVLAGALKLTKTSDSSEFLSVCLDIGSTLTLFRSYSYSGAIAFDGQIGLNPLWGAGNGGGLVNSGNAAAAIQAAADIFYKHSSVLSGNSLVEQSALQLAVWEALYDTTAGGTAYNLTGGGRFSVSPGVPPNNPYGEASITLASIWLSQVDPNARYSGSLLKPEDSLVQEVFYTVTPVPEPTTLIVGALLLLPLAGSAVRHFRGQSVRKA
jgi:hypothetical protein